ncbi:MAG: hypothetical protein FJ317_03190, partial [SAR202 cluster bacterium]|nr:hypothetical protein [SAR202 cluster bacterium]
MSRNLLLLTVCFACLLLLAGACSFFSDAPTPAPSATPTRPPEASPTPLPPTPSPTPSPTPRAVAKASPTPIPTRDVAVPDVGNVNLLPVEPDGWESPLVIASTQGGRVSEPSLSLDAPIFVSIAVGNDGDDLLALAFFVDLYFDGHIVQRFPSGGPLPPRRIATWVDWASLGELVRLTPGEHVLRIVIDPTGLVPEVDETDNVFEVAVRFEGTVTNTTSSSPRRPNLVPVIPEGWEAALIATSYVEDITRTGPLSVNVPTYIGYGFVNEGLSSVPGRVLADLYIDDTFVLRDSWTRILAGSAIEREPWGGLDQVVRLTPGRHTLRLVLDPTNLIDETDETDNVIEREFIWGTGGVPPMTPEPETPVEEFVPAELTLPNLVPGWLWQWDGPIVVSNLKETHRDSRMSPLSSVYLDIVVYNESIVAAEQSFDVDLYFDGQKVNTFTLRAPVLGRTFIIQDDWDGLLRSVQIKEGPHTLKMVIDPKNTVAEVDETDNAFEKTVVWKNAQEPEPAPRAYTRAQLLTALADIQAVLDIREPVRKRDGADHSAAVLRIADAGYYIMTGRSLFDEDADILLLDREEYLAWIDDSYRERFAVSVAEEFPRLVRSLERDKAVSVAKKERRFGKIFIVVDASRNVADVLNSLVHESGHMLQDIRNPAQTEAGDNLELAAIKEAQAQQFERAFWLTI